MIFLSVPAEREPCSNCPKSILVMRRYQKGRKKGRMDCNRGQAVGITNNVKNKGRKGRDVAMLKINNYNFIN